MLTHPVTDSRAWRASTIDERRSWYYPLTPRCLAALDETVRQLRRAPRPATDVRLSETPCASCADDLRPVLEALEAGRGFAILQGLSAERYPAAELPVLYWLVGQMLGRPVVQNVQGTLLYDVRDTGQDVRSGARYSVTSAATGMHTDNSFGEAVVDYVGLLCVHPAKAGGTNQLVSAYTVHNELLGRHADVLEVLYRPFHVDRRGGLRPGEGPTVQFPVLSWDGGGLVCRYLRYWIEAGHEKAGQPLTAAQRRALDVLDGVLGDAGLRAELDLRAGELFFVNNRWLLHGRDAFEDHPEPARRRHYVRLWLQRRG